MSTLQTTFLFLAAGMVLFWLILAASGAPKIEQAGVIAVLRYGTGFRIAALVAALTPPVLMGYLVIAVHWPTNAYLAIAGGTHSSQRKFPCGFAVPRSRGGADRVGLRTASPLLAVDWPLGRSTGPRSNCVHYSPVNRWFVLDGSERDHSRVPPPGRYASVCSHAAAQSAAGPQATPGQHFAININGQKPEPV